MNNKEVIERLKKGDWYVECNTEQDADLVLQACDEAGITWRDGDKATEYKPYDYPVDIGFCNEDNRITHATKYYKKSENENITDWFFNAIKKNDDNGKLTPQNAEQEHWVQIILARLHGIPIEAYSILDNKWIDAGDDCSILMDYKYRIKSKPITTPLPISRELWSYIDKRWRFIAMDRSKLIYLYEEKPTASDGMWLPEDGSYSQCPLNINTDGINWEKSLTERPEGV